MGSEMCIRDSGNKYSYPVVGCNQTQLEEKQVDLLRYGRTYEPLFAYTEDKPEGDWTNVRFDPPLNRSDQPQPVVKLNEKQEAGNETKRRNVHL